MSVDFNYSYQLKAGDPAIAAEVQDNFNDLLEWIKTNYRQVDDTPQLTVMPVLPGSPTIGSHAVNKDYADSIVPTGTVTPFAGDVAPDGYLFCNGGSYSTTGAYQDLFNVINYKFGGSGGSFNVPNLGTKVIVGRTATAGAFDTVGKTGGSGTPTLPQHLHTVPEHGHGNNFSVTGNGGHSHGFEGSGSSSENGEHGHNIGNYTELLYTVAGGGYGINIQTGGGWAKTGPWNGNGYSASYVAAYAGRHNHTIYVSGSVTGDGGHGHGIGGGVYNQPAFNTVHAGEAAITDKNYSPYVVMNYIIKT